MKHVNATDTTMLDALSEEQLARRVQLGCVRSYEELDRRLRPRLVYLLFKRTGSREDAEDLAQDALLRAYRKIDRYHPRRPFRPWLFSIAVRLAIDLYRSRMRNESTTGEGVELAADPGPGPAESAGRRDGQRHLWALADRVLEPVQRTALWLHYGEQQTTRQIAKVLGLSSVNVRVLLYRARRRMMNHLDSPNTERPTVPKPGLIRATGQTLNEGAVS